MRQGGCAAGGSCGDGKKGGACWIDVEARAAIIGWQCVYVYVSNHIVDVIHKHRAANGT